MATCKVVVVRHGKQQDLGLGFTSWGLPAVLTPDGVELAKNFVRLNREILQGCTLFATSPLIRAQQTLFTIMGELGIKVADFDQLVKICNRLYVREPERYMSSDPNETVASWATRNLTFVMEEGERVFEAIKCLIVGPVSAKGGSALCVSHGGPIDLLLAHAKNELPHSNGLAFQSIEDLKKGEGMALYFDDGKLIAVKELRFPK